MGGALLSKWLNMPNVGRKNRCHKNEPKKPIEMGDVFDKAYYEKEIFSYNVSKKADVHPHRYAALKYGLVILTCLDMVRRESMIEKDSHSGHDSEDSAGNSISITAPPVFSRASSLFTSRVFAVSEIFKVVIDHSRIITSYVDGTYGQFEFRPMSYVSNKARYHHLPVGISSMTGPIDINWSLRTVQYPQFEASTYNLYTEKNKKFLSTYIRYNAGTNSKNWTVK